MSLPKMTTPVNNISQLDDLPNAVGGLSAAELKARFDKAGGDIQTFLNETLVPAIEQMGVDEGTARDAAIQAAIDALELDTTVENLQKAIVAAETRAKEYADTKDTANLTAAKQYADSAAASAASAAVTAAASDATTKAAAALTNAKSYTDTKADAILAEAERVSGSDAQNAETAAKQYADKQDAATLTAAKEYTDGKIPSKLPNPQKLKFTGAVTGEYDGSTEKTINIPTGGGAALPEVLSNLGTAMTDAGEGAIPIADGENGWTTKTVLGEYKSSDQATIDQIPSAKWLTTYLRNEGPLADITYWDDFLSNASNIFGAICRGDVRSGSGSNMTFPVLIYSSSINRWDKYFRAIDATGAIWRVTVDLRYGTATETKKRESVPVSAAADAGKLLQVGADGAAEWGDKLPTALKNPQKLKFTGAVTGEYDGSTEKTINIPAGGSDVPAVLGNLGAKMGESEAGAVPVYAGDEAWTIEKIIMAYTGDNDLSGYIPDTAWVVAYMAAQKALLKLLPDSAAADAGKLLQVGADGAAEWGDKLPTALKNPKALTFTGAATGTYDGSGALTVNIPNGYQLTDADKQAIAALVAADGVEFTLADMPTGGSGGSLKALSSVVSYIGIPAADLPENGVVWVSFGAGENMELYTGTITIQDAGIATSDMLAITNGTVNPLNQVAWISDGIAFYGMTTSNYRGVYMVVSG